jgi:hypothetical protein
VLSGAFLFGEVEAYYCPNCGGKVRPAWMISGAGAASRGADLGTRFRGVTTRGASAASQPTGEAPASIDPHDEAYWEAYVARVTGKPPPQHVTRVTPDGKWITFDDGEHFASTADLPPPPAPPPQQPEVGPDSN